MIINGKSYRHARASMSIILDGHVLGRPPILSLHVAGEHTSMEIGGEINEFELQIHITVPMPVRDWRLLDGLTFDATSPGTSCVAWCDQPQMADVESFSCRLVARSGQSFTIELVADVICYDFSSTGVLVTLSVIDQFTLDPISVSVPKSSISPIEDASRLLGQYLDLDSSRLPTLHTHRENGKAEILAYEVHFPTTP